MTSSHQHQHFIVVEELLALFQRETDFCYQPTDYLEKLEISVAALNVVESNDVRLQRRQDYVAMRQKMGEWAYDVIDYHGMSREVVALAMNFTDRYLQVHDHEQQDHDEHDPQDQQEALPSGRSYQLIVMAGLFLAIKLSVGHYFGETVDARTMCAMSRGMFTLEQLLSMETQLLVTLGWRVHPPSPRVFLNHYLSILTNYSGHDQHLLTMLSQVDKKQMHQVRNEADFMLEHAVLDYYFCEHYPSVIAIAALCNTTCYVWPAHVGNPMTLLENILGHAWDDAQVVDCRQRLCDLMVNYHSNQDPGQRRLEQSPEDAIQRIRSPVSVAGDPTTTTTTKAGASPAFSVKTTATAATTASTSTFYSS